MLDVPVFNRNPNGPNVGEFHINSGVVCNTAPPANVEAKVLPFQNDMLFNPVTVLTVRRRKGTHKP